MTSVLVDTGAMVALFASHEPHTAHYFSVIQQASVEHWHLSTTWLCVVEASHLLRPSNRYSLLRWLAQGAVTVFPFDQEIFTDFSDLMRRYTEEPRTGMDLADASLVSLAQKTGVTKIMTTDKRDFSRYKLADGRSFEIL